MRKSTLPILVLLFACSDTFCCSCYPKGRITIKDFNSSDLIFIGKLISESRFDKEGYGVMRKSGYKVNSGYKGAAIGDTVYVCDAEDRGTCGLGRLTVGRDYLIYATGDNMNWTSDCSRTTRVPIQSWPLDSVLINKQKSLVSFGRIDDTAHTNFYADTIFLNRHVLRIHNNTFQKFYDERGNILAEGMYEHGVPEGFWRYFDGGEITYMGKYVKGKKDSMWVEPYNKQMTYLREYRAGVFTYREKVFYDDEITSQTGPSKNGQKWIDYNYYTNGQVRFIAYATPPKKDKYGKTQHPVWDGPFKGFNRAGILLESGVHKNGVSIGRWKYYYEDGKLRMEGDYIQGEKSGLWKIYYPNNRVKAVGTYKNDKKEGSWKYFDEYGKTIPPDPEFIKEDEDWYTYSGMKN